MRGAHARPCPLANRNCLTPSPAPHQRRKCRSPALAPPALPCWEMQGLAATGYRYRNIPDHGPHPIADCDLEALTLSELKNMQKDVAEAISTFEDHQNA